MCAAKRGEGGGAEIRQEISRARPEPSEPSTVSSSGIHRREDLLTGRALLIIIVDKLDNIMVTVYRVMTFYKSSSEPGDNGLSWL